MRDNNNPPVRQYHVELGPWRFLTAACWQTEANLWLSQTARRQRKVDLRPIQHADESHPADVAARRAHSWMNLFALSHLSWWIAAAFMLGASGFALGCAAVQWPQALPELSTRPLVVTWMFVVGAIFFTLAAALQWLQSMSVGQCSEQAFGYSFRFVRTQSLGYWACLIQLAGTLFFNFSTADVLVEALSPAQQELFIWTPNLLGSVCFLLASQLAVMEYAHGWGRWAPQDLSWWIVYLNLSGSVLFGVSAAGSFVLPGGGQIAPQLANLTTLAGALCFLVAAYLLIPESQEELELILPA